MRKKEWHERPKMCSVPKAKLDDKTMKRVGVGDGNRTRVPSLEGWCSTIELHRHI